MDLLESHVLGASLFQLLEVTGLQRLSSCANRGLDEGCPKSVFLHRGLRGGLFDVLFGQVVPFGSCSFLSAYAWSRVDASDCGASTSLVEAAVNDTPAQDS